MKNRCSSVCPQKNAGFDFGFELGLPDTWLWFQFFSAAGY